MLLSAALFGTKHISGLIIVVTLVIIGLWLLEKYQPRKERILIIFAVLFLVLESIKIVFLWVKTGNYPQNHLPFHLCSLPLYMYPLIAFVKSEKVKQFIYPAAYATVLIGGFIALLYPVNIIGETDNWALVKDNFLPYLSFVFHGLMILAPIYLLRSGLYKITFPKLREAYIVSVIFMVMAIIVNTILDQDFMLLNYGNGSPFQFIIEINQILYTVTMILLGLLAILIFHSVTILIVRIKNYVTK